MVNNIVKKLGVMMLTLVDDVKISYGKDGISIQLQMDGDDIADIKRESKRQKADPNIITYKQSSPTVSEIFNQSMLEQYGRPNYTLGQIIERHKASLNALEDEDTTHNLD